MNGSAALATVLVDELVHQGVTEAVLAPGSRSAPLAYALHTADIAGRLRLHVRVDERTAAYLALGLAKASGRPVPVVTTSGTAVANAHPAVLEADASGVPLVVVTADRPPELRGTGANQTTDQLGIFGRAVRTFADVAAPEERAGQVAYWRNVVIRALASARGVRSADPGPVHLNVALRDPLMPGDGAWLKELDDRTGGSVLGPAADPPAEPLSRGPRTVVVAGDAGGRDGSAARRIAEAAGWPLLAEPSSGARCGPNALGPYRLLLEHEALAGDIERVVAFGRPTLSRAVIRLLGRRDVELVVVSPYGAQWVDPSRSADLVVPAVALGDGPGEGPQGWLRRWLDADARARAAINAVLADEPALTGPLVARTVAAALPAGALLVVGSSNPVRDLDLAAAPWEQPVCGLANRGVAGIDGTLSTAVGAALASQRHRPRSPGYALMGDLTFLHDANGLVIGPGEPRPDLTVVVVNDDGGGIFGLLEQGAPEHAAAFERIFGTPTGVDLAALCAATRTPHLVVRTEDDLRTALVPLPGIRVVEVRTDRGAARALHNRLRDAVLAALAPA